MSDEPRYGKWDEETKAKFGTEGWDCGACPFPRAVLKPDREQCDRCGTLRPKDPPPWQRKYGKWVEDGRKLWDCCTCPGSSTLKEPNRDICQRCGTLRPTEPSPWDPLPKLRPIWDADRGYFDVRRWPQYFDPSKVTADGPGMTRVELAAMQDAAGWTELERLLVALLRSTDVAWHAAAAMALRDKWAVSNTITEEAVDLLWNHGFLTLAIDPDVFERFVRTACMLGDEKTLKSLLQRSAKLALSVECSWADIGRRAQVVFERALEDLPSRRAAEPAVVNPGVVTPTNLEHLDRVRRVVALFNKIQRGEVKTPLDTDLRTFIARETGVDRQIVKTVLFGLPPLSGETDPSSRWMKTVAAATKFAVEERQRQAEDGTREHWRARALAAEDKLARITRTNLDPMAVRRTHELKTWREPFRAFVEDRKLFEFRKNDRDFRVDDGLFLKEWDETADRYTGEYEFGIVTYALYGPEYGIPVGYCVLSVVKTPALPPAPSDPLQRLVRGMRPEEEKSFREHFEACVQSGMTAVPLPMGRWEVVTKPPHSEWAWQFIGGNDMLAYCTAVYGEQARRRVGLKT